MGRHLACGIASRIKISNDKSWYCCELDIKKEKDNILKKLGENLDLDFYNISCNDKSIILDINIDKVKESIYELLKDMNAYININTYCADILKEKNVDVEDCLELDDIYFFDPDILLKDYDWSSDLKFNVSCICLWIDPSKINVDFEYNICNLLANFSRKIFKAKLSKTIIFYISG